MLICTHVDPESEWLGGRKDAFDDEESEESRVTHIGNRKPCCCLSLDVNFSRNFKKPSVQYTRKLLRAIAARFQRDLHRWLQNVRAGNLNDDMEDTPSTSDQSDSEFTIVQSANESL
ncbi:unnamed protein product [Lactuca virosa]|uniref:Uncharacterized protein n=1 Tax=Lactuca virosa TaxID=75947 RepID=A0AAU9NG23_9ASTR|nr:unnamed protein product [Lactuca virosa]